VKQKVDKSDGQMVKKKNKTDSHINHLISDHTLSL